MNAKTDSPPRLGIEAQASVRRTENPSPITARALLTQHRGGGLYTVAVSQRVGAGLGALTGRMNAHPSMLTLGSLLFGLTGSGLAAAAGLRGWWLLGLLATAAWQVAYALDCADGQLARLTNRTSPQGARLDILVDFLVQTSVVTSLATVSAKRSHAPAALIAAFSALWMFNLLTSVLGGRDDLPSLLPSANTLTATIKLVRDYGFISLVAGGAITVLPGLCEWLMVFYTVLNGIFVVVLVAREARHSMSPREAE